MQRIRTRSDQSASSQHDQDSADQQSSASAMNSQANQPLDEMIHELSRETERIPSASASEIALTTIPAWSESNSPEHNSCQAKGQTCPFREGDKSYDYRQGLIRRLVLGGLLGASATLALLLGLMAFNPCLFSRITGASTCSATAILARTHQGFRGQVPAPTGISSYLDLFSSTFSSADTNPNQTPPPRNHNGRKLASEQRNKDPQLVIAGKMSVEGAPCNIAQYNLKNNKWSLEERIQLSLYNSYSGGEVYSLLANHTEENTTKAVKR